MNKKYIILFLLLIATAIFWAVKSRPSLTNSNTSISKSLCNNCNLIIIAYDALQAKHVSHLGYKRETTPFIDKIAADGISFKNNISTAPWTVPSYMSIFTGLYPSEHKIINKFVKFTKEEKVVSNLHQISPQVITLAQVMKDNGYITGGFTGDAGINSVFGYNQGFDIYFDQSTFGSVQTAGEKAIEWLKENKDEKFLLFLHGYDSHGQFAIPSDYKGRFSNPNYKGKYKGTPQEQRDLRESGLSGKNLNLSDDDVEFWQSWYDSKIRDADDRVANIYSQLEKMEVLKNTVIMVISDHGTELYEHNRFDHGHTLYDELINVPLVISSPSLPKGKIIDNQISTLDISSTILQLLDLKVDPKYLSQQRGKSLLPLILGQESWSKNVFMETDYRNFTHKRGIRTADGWKFIMTMETKQKEFYNLNNDPKEKNNLLDQEPSKAYELENILMNHLESTGTNPYSNWDSDCLPVYTDQCL